MSIESARESADRNDVQEAVAELAMPSSEPRWMMLRRTLLGIFAGRAQKGLWVLADQGIVSIGNFATTILVGRAADASHFGTFGMLMEVYLFVNSLQSALVVYPLSVRGAVLDKEALKRMASACLAITLVLCVPLSLAMAGTTAIFHQTSILVWVCLAMVLAQVQETLRRTLLAHLQFRDAIPGDSVSYLLQAAILFLLLRQGHLNLATAFITMGATSAMAAIVQALQIGLRPISMHHLAGIAADFWHLGRWILFANVATLAGSLGYNWTLALRWSTTQVAFFYVISAPMKLVNPLMIAVGSVIIPTVSRAHHRIGAQAAKIVGMKYLGLAGLLLIPYVLLVLLFPRQITLLLFKRPEYLSLTAYIRVFAIGYAMGFVSNGILACLNGLGDSRANFNAMMANSLTSALISLPLAYIYGLKGIIIGGFIANVAYLSCAIYQLFRFHGPPIVRDAQSATAE